MSFWDTVLGRETAEAIIRIGRDLNKKQQVYTTHNSEAQKAIKDMIKSGYTVIHVIPGEEETVIIYK